MVGDVPVCQVGWLAVLIEVGGRLCDEEGERADLTFWLIRRNSFQKPDYS